jgi:plasmid stabilization system protein ParE
MEVVWSRLAKETLVDILNYVESNYGRIVATKVYDRINRHVETLMLFPRIGMRVPLYANNEIEVRYLINTPNIIHYLITGNTIIVISVLDTRRSPMAINKIVSDFIESNAKY